MAQSPSNNNILDELSISSSLKFSNNQSQLNFNSSLLSSQQPKRQRSCDIIDSRTIILAKSAKQQNSTSTGTVVLATTTNAAHNCLQQINYPTSLTIQQQKYNLSINSAGSLSPLSPLSPISPPNANILLSNQSSLLSPITICYAFNKPQMRKSITVQNQQTFNNLQKNSQIPKTNNPQDDKNVLNDSEQRVSGELNVLLDAEVINDYPTQALVLTVLATLVRNSTDENEIRILYQYIAEASIVFSKVFPVIHNLLDSKINHILQLSLDESILDSVQSIIQNMISSCEMSDSNQQQLSYLQSCGFGGLWRFAQPFSVSREKPENVELFVDCLEAMVETCLAPDDESFSCIESSLNSTNNVSQSNDQSSNNNIVQCINGTNNISLTCNLINGSMSSISMSSIHSPTDRDLFDLNEINGKARRNSSPKNVF